VVGEDRDPVDVPRPSLKQAIGVQGAIRSAARGYGRNDCSIQPYPELPFELEFAA
jgi:hypothetical protein